MDTQKIGSFVNSFWDETVLPTLKDYVAIPALSPLFDTDWEKSGHLEKAMQLMADWCRKQPVKGMKVEIVRLPGRTPLLFLEVEGDAKETVLLYGHMDKQPPVTGWREGLGPWKPVVEDGKLYGRGSADDGYAVFSAVAAIRALQEQEVPHARCVVLIEASEESGSSDLPAYIEHLTERIGPVNFIVCLDSGAGNYEQLWATTSLRGIVVGSLHVNILSEGVHSGSGSGIFASSFRIARILLSRIEDENTGEIRVKEFHTEIPPERQEQIRDMARILGESVYRDFPLLAGFQPLTTDVTELVINNTWRPALAVVGADGFPALENAGNVMRPYTALKLSLRLPPRVDADKAAARLKEILEADPPYGATVRFDIEGPGSGWDAPPFAPWLQASLDRSSRAFFGKPPAFLGEGGSIPFMNLLGEKYPQAQFLITGVLGPESNAHGPNEFLHLATAKNVTACVSQALADHFQAVSGG